MGRCRMPSGAKDAISPGTAPGDACGGSSQQVGTGLTRLSLAQGLV